MENKFRSKSDRLSTLYNVIIGIYVGLNLTALGFNYELPTFVHILIVAVALKIVNSIKGR